MPGDPLRARFIAEEFLVGAQLVSDLRNVYAYTGRYRGKRISVVASGMGVSSMGIYSYELFHFYNVDRIIRVGSAGGLHPALKLRDLVVGTASSTDTGYAHHLGLPGNIAPVASFDLVEKAMQAARAKEICAMAGPLFCGSAFYYDKGDMQKWADIGMLAVEMESASLYLNAARAGKQALTICTISDLVLSEKCTGMHG